MPRKRVSLTSQKPKPPEFVTTRQLQSFMLKRILGQLKDFFGISRKQARGAAVLIIFTFCLIWLPFLYRRLILPLFPIEKESYDVQKLDSIAKQISKQPDIAAIGYKKKENDKSEHTPSVSVRLSVFDPNMANIDQLQQLGIPAFLAKRILNYRSKGGKFRKKEDLLHIYDFPAELYKKLEPYIQLSQVGNVVPDIPANKSNAENTGSPTFSKSKIYSPDRPINIKKQLIPFDINQADTTELVKLKGIGSKLSQRILKFRDALGGFYSQSQFTEIYGLDSLAISQLMQFGKIASPVRKLQVNQMSAEQLAIHPYLRNRKLANVIVSFREQHGHYTSSDDLKKIRIMDEATLQKIAPYLEF